jgi:hypothetical protein
LLLLLLLCVQLGLLPLVCDLLLLALLRLLLGLGKSSLLLMHTWVEPDGRNLLLLDRAGVDEVVLVVVEGHVVVRCIVHGHVHVHANAAVPSFHHRVIAHHLQSGRREDRVARVKAGVQAGDGASGNTSLLLEALILVAGFRSLLQFLVDGGAGRAGNG